MIQQYNDSKPRKILIADDDSSISRALYSILSSYGKTSIVDSGNKAIAALKNQEFDLILTDYEMDDGSGLDLLEYLAEQNIKTPTIMITAFGTKDLVLKSLKYNIYGFIEKPFTQNVVEDLAKKALKTKDEADKIQKLALLGVNLGEVVHEINNPLTVLDISVNQLDEDGNHADPIRMKKSLNKIKDIITNTKDEIRGNRIFKGGRFNLSEIINEAKVEFDLKAKKNNTPVQFIGDFDIELEGSSSRIRQVIVNLVNNAIDAVSEQEPKWVNIRLEREVNSIKLIFTDSGNGIPPEIRNRLFEPLFSTKGANGTGLGLGIVRKIANEHGGNVYLNTECKNTEFVLILPE